MRILGLVAVAAMTISIGSCGAIDKYASVVTLANLDVSRNTYDTILAGAATYNELPCCAAGPSTPRWRRLARVMPTS